MTSFALTAGPHGPARVVVEGVDVTRQVSAACVTVSANGPTTLTLQVVAGGHIDAAGVVEVIDPGLDRGAVARDFLASVDPKALDHVMANGGAGLTTGPRLNDSPGALALTALLDWAGEW